MFKWFIGSFLRKNHLSLYCVVFFFAIARHGKHLSDHISGIRLKEIAVSSQEVVHQRYMFFGVVSAASPDVSMLRIFHLSLSLIIFDLFAYSMMQFSASLLLLYRSSCHYSAKKSAEHFLIHALRLCNACNNR